MDEPPEKLLALEVPLPRLVQPLLVALRLPAPLGGQVALQLLLLALFVLLQALAFTVPDLMLLVSLPLRTPGTMLLKKNRIEVFLIHAK